MTSKIQKDGEEEKAEKEEHEMLTVYTNFNSFKAHSNSYYLHSICKEMGAFGRLCDLSKLVVQRILNEHGITKHMGVYL